MEDELVAGAIGMFLGAFIFVVGMVLAGETSIDRDTLNELCSNEMGEGHIYYAENEDNKKIICQKEYDVENIEGSFILKND